MVGPAGCCLMRLRTLDSLARSSPARWSASIPRLFSFVTWSWMRETRGEMTTVIPPCTLAGSW